MEKSINYVLGLVTQQLYDLIVEHNLDGISSHTMVTDDKGKNTMVILTVNLVEEGDFDD